MTYRIGLALTAALFLSMARAHGEDIPPMAGTPVYALAEDFMAALQRRIPGTGPTTTPAYLFNRPDSEWVMGESFVMLITDAGGNTDALFLNGPALNWEEAVDPANGYAVDSDGDGLVDTISEQYYLDRSVATVQNLNWRAMAMPFATVDHDGFHSEASAVFGVFAEGKYVAGIRIDTVVDMTVEDSELGAVTARIHTNIVHPVSYLADYGAAVSWAQLLSNGVHYNLEDSPIGPLLLSQEIGTGEGLTAFTFEVGATGQIFSEGQIGNLANYRETLATAPEAVAEWYDGQSYVAADRLGNMYVVPLPEPSTRVGCAVACDSALKARQRAAHHRHSADAADCTATAATFGVGTVLAVSAGCCRAGAAVGAPFAPEGPLGGCIIGAVGCGAVAIAGWGVATAACFESAAAAELAALQEAQALRAECCAQCDEEDCIPNE